MEHLIQGQLCYQSLCLRHQSVEIPNRKLYAISDEIIKHDITLCSFCLTNKWAIHKLNHSFNNLEREDMDTMISWEQPSFKAFVHFSIKQNSAVFAIKI